MDISEDIAEIIVKNYNLGKKISINKDNIGEMSQTYFLTTTQGNYVVKIRSNKELNDTLFELEIMAFLYHQGLPVQEIIKNIEGEEITHFNSELIYLLEYVEGKNPLDMDKKLILECTRNLALLDKALLEKRNIKRDGWPLFHQELYEIFSQKDEFLNEHKVLYDEFKSLNLKELRKSIIHGDYRQANLIVNNGKLKCIIDFGDAHYDFLILDLANAMIGCLLNQNKKFQFSLLKHVVKEYEHTLPLRLEEKRALYYFFKIRLILIINHYIKQLENNFFNENICNSIIKDLKGFLASITDIDFKRFFNEINF